MLFYQAPAIGGDTEVGEFCNGNDKGTGGVDEI